MGRRSKLDDMPEEIRAEFFRLVRARHTIAEIREHLAKLEEPVSNGAAGRMVKNAREFLMRREEADKHAETWARELGERPRGDMGVMLTEMLQLITYNTIGLIETGKEKDGEKKSAKPMEIMMLAKAMQSLESTAKASTERREKIERLVLERQVKVAQSAAKSAGVSDEAFEVIRAKFLGIYAEPSNAS